MKHLFSQLSFLLVGATAFSQTQIDLSDVSKHFCDNRKAFGKAPELDYKDQEVCVVGKVEVFREKPQVVLYSSRQLIPAHALDQH